MKTNGRFTLGFTLIELLVVMMILGIIAVMIVGNFFTSLKKGRDAKRKADLIQIQRGVELYYEDKRSYPDSISTQESIRDSVSGKVYLQKIPTDPTTGAHYGYETDAEGTYYKLYSCLENNLQILPYLSSPTGFSCTNKCRDQDDNLVNCIWGISSGNTSP